METTRNRDYAPLLLLSMTFSSRSVVGEALGHTSMLLSEAVCAA